MNSPEFFKYSMLTLALFLFLSITVLILTWMERKTLARIQMRLGPMHVGFHGTVSYTHLTLPTICSV